MSQKMNGYVLTNGNTATTGYVSENDFCITNSFPSINYYALNKGYSGPYATYNSTKCTDDVFQR
jgi:hypothetical protein